MSHRVPFCVGRLSCIFCENNLRKADGRWSLGPKFHEYVYIQNRTISLNSLCKVSARFVVSVKHARNTVVALRAYFFWDVKNEYPIT